MNKEEAVANEIGRADTIDNVLAALKLPLSGE